jgi:hypothetical protein
MGECLLCHQKGLFLSISDNGLCRQCDVKVVLEVKQRGRIIEDSIKFVEESKNLVTRLGRLDLIIKQLEVIEEYHKKGIPTLKPSPTELKKTFNDMRDGIIEETLRKQYDDVKTRLDVGQSLSRIEDAIVKLIMEIKEYKSNLNNKSHLDALENDIMKFQNRIQLGRYTDGAKKAEFKGQWKKALDQYKEALFYLKNDKFDDIEQNTQINQMNSKIEELEIKISKL